MEAAKNWHSTAFGSKKIAANLVIFLFFFVFLSNLRPHFYLVLDSYSRLQTRESLESGKNSLEYESFEYESGLDTPLVKRQIEIVTEKTVPAY